MSENEECNNLVFSIIIPVYNTAKYVENCVASVLQQAFPVEAYEILLIDDGSVDASGALCDQLAQQYEQVRVFHQSNQGLSMARNKGISKAKGSYILFLDSDDALANDAFLPLYEIIKQHSYDIIVTDMNIITSTTQSYCRHSHQRLYEEMDGRTFLLQELKHHSMHMAAVMNVYRRAFLLENALTFKSGILHEDEQFTPRAFLKAASIIAIDHCYYRYMIRENSITTNKKLYKNVKDLYETLTELSLIYQKEEAPLCSYLMESLLEKYLYMYAKAGVYQSAYDGIRNKQFVKGKAKSLKNKAKVCLFTISDRMYCKIHPHKEG